MKKILLLNTLLVSLNALAMGGKIDPEGVEGGALSYLSQRGGVTPEALQDFTDAQKTPLAHQNTSTDLCFKSFGDTVVQRSQFLDCLAKFNGTHWGYDWGLKVFNLRRQIVHLNTTPERARSLALLRYLDDLNREVLGKHHHAASWIHTQTGFNPAIKQHHDFDFQNGDVILGLGNSSLSAVISQFNDVSSNYSHAFLVKKDAQGFTTLESLVETGVKEFPWKHFVRDPYNQLTVLRWKNPADRSKIANWATAWAAQKAKEASSYDFKMDLNSDDSLYCSELVIKAYAKASGISLTRLIPRQSRVKDSKVFSFAQKFGVSRQQYIAPGDLLNSPYFEVVAEYRRQENLMRSWEVYLWGDLFLSEISKGAELKPDPIFVGVPLTIWTAQLLPSLFHEDARLIPKGISPSVLSLLATQEKKIFKPSLETFKRDYHGARSLLSVPAWKIRASFQKAFRANLWIRTSLDN